MSEDRWFAKKPCQHCPFRRDVKPFLHPERAAEIAYSAQNPYSEFHCHKTLGHDEEEGDTMVVAGSLVCAGFLAMQLAETNMRQPEGFKLPTNCYEDASEMIDRYEEVWKKDGN